MITDFFEYILSAKISLICVISVPLKLEHRFNELNTRIKHD